MRPLQPEPTKPGHCERWVGQVGQGMFKHFALDVSWSNDAFCEHYKYLLLQSLRAMRQSFTGELMIIHGCQAKVLNQSEKPNVNLASFHRSGNLLLAASKPTTLVTPVTSTPSLSPLTALSAHLEARTAPPCSGILTSRNTSTPSPPATKSTLLSFPLTDTGYAPQHPAQSSSSIWRRRARSTS